MEIQTSRLIIDELAAGDKANIQSIAADTDVMRYLVVWLDTDEQVNDFLNSGIISAQNTDRRLYLQGVRDCHDSRFIGVSYIEIESPGESTAEIGYILLKQNWNQGLAQEIVAAQIDFCFNTLKLHRVYGKCDELNIASAGVMEKCGMKYEGTLREHVWLRDHWRSSRYYAVIAG